MKNCVELRFSQTREVNLTMPVRELTDDWIREYNEERPHESLGNLTPWEYLDTVSNAQNSNLQCN